MRTANRRRPALVSASVVAAAAMVATGLVSGSADAATGKMKVSPRSGPVGTTVKISGTCSTDGPRVTWTAVIGGLYLGDAFVAQHGLRSHFVLAATKISPRSGKFTGTVTVPATASYLTAGATETTPGDRVTRKVSGKVGLQLACMASGISTGPIALLEDDDAFNVTTAGKKLKVTKKPKVKGKKKVGKKLRATKGKWKPKPDSFAYQWKRGKKDIAGATKKRYTVTSRDAGKKLRVVVTAERDGYKTRSSKSKKVKIKASKRSLAIQKRDERRQERRERARGGR